MASNQSGIEILDVISPVYNAQSFITEFLSRITRLKLKDFKELNLILIDDSSTDSTIRAIYDFASTVQSDWNIIVLSLPRNMGQHAATKAGMQIASGDYVVIMDCDLEHDANLIPILAKEALKSRADAVFVRINTSTWKSKLIFRKLVSKVFARIYTTLYSEKRELQGISTFRIVSQKIIREALKFKELEDFSGIVITELVKNYKVLENVGDSTENNGTRYSVFSRIDIFLKFVVSRVPQLSLAMILVSSILIPVIAVYVLVLLLDIVFFGGGLPAGVNQVVILLCLALTFILFLGGLCLFAIQYLIRLIKKSEQIPLREIKRFDKNPAF